MILNDEKNIDLFVGSRIGSLKHIKYYLDVTINCKKFTENLVDIKSLQKDDGITCMEWENAKQTKIFIARKNKQIEVFNTKKSEVVKTYQPDLGEGHIVGLWRSGTSRVAAVSSGRVTLWTSVTHETIDTGGKLDTMKGCPDDHTLFLTGGEENDLKIWRIGESAPNFVAKNLPADSLQLRRPVWVTGACWPRGSQGRLAAACSRLGHVRLYDPRVQRRPIMNIECTGLAAVCIEPGMHDEELMVGFARGQLRAVDLRMKRLSRSYEGAVGAITAICCLPPTSKNTSDYSEAPLVISASIDRHVRVHNHGTKQLLYKQYVTSKVSALLAQTETCTPLRQPPFSSLGGLGEAEGETRKEPGETEEGPDEMDELFDSMQTITHTRPHHREKKKASIEAEETSKKRSKPSEDKVIPVEERKEVAIAALLRSTERQKRRAEKRKKQKKAKSVFSNV